MAGNHACVGHLFLPGNNNRLACNFSSFFIFRSRILGSIVILGKACDLIDQHQQLVSRPSGKTQPDVPHTTHNVAAATTKTSPTKQGAPSEPCRTSQHSEKGGGRRTRQNSSQNPIGSSEASEKMRENTLDQAADAFLASSADLLLRDPEPSNARSSPLKTTVAKAAVEEKEEEEKCVPTFSGTGSETAARRTRAEMGDQELNEGAGDEGDEEEEEGFIQFTGDNKSSLGGQGGGSDVVSAFKSPFPEEPFSPSRGKDLLADLKDRREVEEEEEEEDQRSKNPKERSGDGIDPDDNDYDDVEDLGVEEIGAAASSTFASGKDERRDPVEGHYRPTQCDENRATEKKKKKTEKEDGEEEEENEKSLFDLAGDVRDRVKIDPEDKSGPLSKLKRNSSSSSSSNIVGQKVLLTVERRDEKEDRGPACSSYSYPSPSHAESPENKSQGGRTRRSHREEAEEKDEDGGKSDDNDKGDDLTENRGLATLPRTSHLLPDLLSSATAKASVTSTLPSSMTDTAEGQKKKKTKTKEVGGGEEAGEENIIAEERGRRRGTKKNSARRDSDTPSEDERSETRAYYSEAPSSSFSSDAERQKESCRERRGPQPLTGGGSSVDAHFPPSPSRSRPQQEQQYSPPPLVTAATHSKKAIHERRQPREEGEVVTKEKFFPSPREGEAREGSRSHEKQLSEGVTSGERSNLKTEDGDNDNELRRTTRTRPRAESQMAAVRSENEGRSSGRKEPEEFAGVVRRDRVRTTTISTFSTPAELPTLRETGATSGASPPAKGTTPRSPVASPAATVSPTSSSSPFRMRSLSSPDFMKHDRVYDAERDWPLVNDSDDEHGGRAHGDEEDQMVIAEAVGQHEATASLLSAVATVIQAAEKPRGSRHNSAGEEPGLSGNLRS